MNENTTLDTQQEKDIYDMSLEELEEEIKKYSSNQQEQTTDTVTTQLTEDIEEQSTDNGTPTNPTEQPNDNTIDKTDLEEPVAESKNGENIGDETKYYKIKANGKELDVTFDELKKLASMGVDYTRKTTELKGDRQLVSVAKDNGITLDDLNMLIDIKKGSKDAIAKLLQDTGIDVYDLPENSNYTPTQYGKPDNVLDFEETLKSLAYKDPGTHARVVQFLNTADEKTLQHFFNNPSDIRGLDVDIQSGVFDIVDPMVQKAVVLGDTRSYLDIYRDIGGRYYRDQVSKGIDIYNRNTSTSHKTNTQFSPEIQNGRMAIKNSGAIPKAGYNTRPSNNPLQKLNGFSMDELRNSDEAYNIVMNMIKRGEN